MIINNRRSQFPNRKILFVQESKLDDNGNIEELIVDEYRREGLVFEEGTQLSARNLELILKKYYVYNLYAEWIQSDDEKSRDFLIETAIPLDIIITNEAGKYLEIEVIEHDDHHILINVKDTIDSRGYIGSNAEYYTFNIKLISKDKYMVNNVVQEGIKKIVADLTGKIKYIFSSESPLD